METKRLTIPAAEEIVDRYFPVLDHGFVALKDYMGGDLAVEESARVSYGEGTRQINDTRHLLRYLFRHRHSSPFEMCELRFHIGLPIFVMRQLIRHRTANVNEYSGRYSVMPLMFYSPGESELKYQSKQNKQGGALQVSDQHFRMFMDRSQVTRSLAKGQYQDALGLDIARELARIDLPLSMYTYCYWKIDLRNLFNVISLRDNSHAQEQIQAYGHVLGGIAKRVAPLAMDAFQDYQQGAVTFCQAELAALLYGSSMGVGYQEWLNPPTSFRDTVNNVLDLHGVLFTKSGRESREQTEFWEKLKPRVKKSYDLDVSTTRDGSFYEELAKQHAYEVPSNG